MRKPNCIIVGCQKCGTSALQKYIAQHPDIWMTRSEVHYFDRKKKSPIKEYLSIFDKHDEKIVGEKTPNYCYFEEIPTKIAELNPNCKIIMCVREPVARAYSEYQMLKLNGVCNDRWEDVWNTRDYLTHGLYAKQLKNLYKSFNPKQVLVIKSEDLYSKRSEVVKRVFKFLDVDDTFIPPQLRDVHQGGVGRFKLLTCLVRVLIFTRELFSQFKWGYRFGDYIQYLTMCVKIVNKKSGYKPMTKKMQKKIQEYYKEPNEEFYKMTGIRWEYE
jgi:hypothetical protein